MGTFLKSSGKNAAAVHLYHYSAKKVKGLGMQLKKAVASFDQEAIHNIRVDIKKLRIVFRLLEKAAPLQLTEEAIYRLFKPVFKCAGAIRQSQLNLSSMNRFTKNRHMRSAYQEYLAGKDRKKRGALKQEISKMDIPSLAKKMKTAKRVCREMDDVFLLKCLKQCIRKEVVELNGLKHKTDNPETFHAIRKHLKALIYLLSFFRKLQPKSRIQTLTTHLKDIESKLANWHDLFMFATSVMAFSQAEAQSLNAEELQATHNLSGNITRETAKLHAGFARKLDQLLIKLRKMK